MVTELNSDYKSVLKDEKKPYVLEFYSESCGTCKQVMPLFAEVASEHADEYGFYKANVENLMDFAKEHGVNSVPTLLFIEDEQVKEKHSGYITKEEITAKIEKHFS